MEIRTNGNVVLHLLQHVPSRSSLEYTQEPQSHHLLLSLLISRFLSNSVRWSPSASTTSRAGSEGTEDGAGGLAVSTEATAGRSTSRACLLPIAERDRDTPPSATPAPRDAPVRGDGVAEAGAVSSSMCVISYFVPSVSLSKLYFIERAPVDRSYVRDQIASDPARDRSGDGRKRPPRRLLSLRHDTRRRLDAVLDPSARAFVHPERMGVVGFDGTAREPSAKSPSRVRVTSEGEPSARHLRRKMRATAWERKE